MDEFIGKFLGPDKILSIVEEKVRFDGPESEGYTYLRVELERMVDKKSTTITLLWHPAIFKAAVTDEATDLTELQDARVLIVRNAILELMMKYAITIGEVDYINQRVLTSINHTASRANDKLWGQAAKDRNLIDVNSVLNDGGKEN